MKEQHHKHEPQPTKTKRLKLLSYNVQVGIPSKKYRHYVTNSWKHILPFSERRNNLDQISEFISEFDIVGLLELDSGSIRSEFLNQPQYLARKADFDYCYTRINRDLGILGQHSLALFSRHEASFVREHVLPSRIPGRGALEVHFSCGDDEPLVVILAHLSLLPRARHKQLSYISKLVCDHKYAVVMGDLNTTIESPEIHNLLESTHLEAPTDSLHTFPSWKPRVAYDHILVTPYLKSGESEVYGVKHSDHLPIGQEVRYPYCSLDKTSSQ